MRLLFAFVALASAVAADEAPLLMQKPTLSKTHIVFAYAGDLWARAARRGRCRAFDQRQRQRDGSVIFA